MKTSSLFDAGCAFFHFRKLGLAALFLLAVLGGPLVERSPGQIVSTNWGNTYQLGGGQTAAVTTANTQWVTFTATQAMTISAADIYNGTAITGTPVLTVGIYAVDGSNVPTGAALGSNTFTPSVGTNVWQRVTLPSVALTSGVVYAMKVSTATAGTTYPWRLNQGATGGLQPYGTPDTHFWRGVNTTVPTAANGQNVWYLETDIGRAIGQPYTSSTAQGAASTTTTLGQKFSFDKTGTNDQVSAVTLQLGIVTAPPANPVTLKLIDASGAVLATTSLNLSGAPLGAANYTFDFAAPVTLTDTSSYYLGLFSNGSTADSVKWYGWNTSNDSLSIGASFEGSSAYATSWLSQSNFTVGQTPINTRDYNFNLTLVPEPSTMALALVGGLGILLLARRRLARA